MTRSLGLALALGTGLIVAVGCDQPRETAQLTALANEEPPRVFRSTLDGRTRVLTARLADDLWVAWDVEQAALFKLWRDGVDLDGAVYTGRHGPQPESQGPAWLASRYPAPWRIWRGGRELRPEVDYRGHRVEADGVTLSYALVGGDALPILVEERARRVVDDQGLPGLEIVFRYDRYDRYEPAGSELLLDLPLGGLDPEADVETDGVWVARPTFSDTARSGRLVLRPEGTTRVVFWLRGEPAVPKRDLADPDAPPGQVLVEQADCLVCHGIERGTVGPGFREVAVRYGPDEADGLAAKVMSGGAGVWGGVAMAPHPDLPMSDARQMVDWILTLDGGVAPVDEEPLPSRDLFSGWGDYFDGVWRELAPANHPGDGLALSGVHPSFDLETVRPAGFAPRVGGLDFLSDGSLVVASWDPHGGVYRIEGLAAAGPLRVERIAAGLAEPLGLRVVDDEIYVLQKPELTRLVDQDGDGQTDAYETVSDDWTATPNFHEFAFGLAYRDDFFYATLATAILPGGASAPDQAPDRGHVVRIPRRGGATTFPAHGLRTPNGVGFGPLGRLYVTDNQGDWLPSSKVLALDPDASGVFFGSRSVGGEAVAELSVTPPVVWLPQGEIGNSPGEPLPIEIGPWAGQLLVADVTHGGLKRVFVQEMHGVLQGAVFRFSQGFEAGLNRAVWGPDGRLYVGGIGSNGNWGQAEKERFGLQRLRWNRKPTFEMLAVRAVTGGLEIELSEPVAGRDRPGADAFRVEDWRYEPTEKYGGPKVDVRSLQVADVSWSDDGRRVTLGLPELRSGRVAYLRLAKDAFESERGQRLWSTESWVTLNALPVATPVAKDERLGREAR